MTLKRKRSGSAPSPFSTASSATRSSRDLSSSPPPDTFMHDGQPLPAQQPQIEPSYLHSRTRKRYRDNRPDESTIHENTYQKLFAAARSPRPFTPSPPSPIFQYQPQPPPRQPSLHTFWAIPSNVPPIADATLPLPPAFALCQDCDGALPSADEDTSMGGMREDRLEDSYVCRSCRRTVCDVCAVVEVGAGRECLQCRTSTHKIWVGGIGWMPQ